MPSARAATPPNLSLGIEARRHAGSARTEPQGQAMQRIASHGLTGSPASSVQRLLDGALKLIAAARASGAQGRLTASPVEDGRRRPVDLCRIYGPAVYRRCLRILEDEQAAGEATQAILVALANDARMLRAADEPSALLKRVYRAATHHCLDLLYDLDTRDEAV
jgi:hypothetical protein